MMMEWNSKTPALWDWDNPTFFSAAAAAGTGAAAGSGGGGGGGGSPSGSSASIDSSPYIRPPSVAFEAAQEPPIGLKLGKRTYFEDVCVGSGGAGGATAAAAAAAVGSRNPASSSTSSSPSAAAGTVAVGEAFVKRPRVAHQSVQVVRCQVEGCNIDLTGGKEYHRKHRVCEGHSKSPLVVVAGQQRRFCQQCSRFHDPSAFDEKKRSCRKRLADHNARRRKPQQGAISYNPVKLTSSFCDERQQMSLLFNRAPFGHVRPSAISTWEGSCDFKFSHVKGPWTKSTKGGIEGQLLPGTDLSSSVTTLHHDLDRLSPFKVTTTEVLNQGTEASAVSSNLNGASDLRRALSLLSTDSWGSAEPAPTTSLAQPVHTNQTGAVHAIHAANAASHYWEDEQPLPQPVPPARVLPFALQSNSSHFQEFQLFKSPYDGAFFDSSQIH